jgi:hypothetical protein
MNTARPFSTHLVGGLHLLLSPDQREDARVPVKAGGGDEAGVARAPRNLKVPLVACHQLTHNLVSLLKAMYLTPFRQTTPIVCSD